MAFGNGEYLLGYESIPVSSVAHSLTDSLLALAFAAEITVTGGAVRFTTDGSTVTAVSGRVLNPGEKFLVDSAAKIAAFSMIRDGTQGAELRVTYFKRTAPITATDLVATGTLDVTGAATLASTLAVTGAVTVACTLTVTGAFGCNAASAQTAVASGGALSAYVTGAFGLNSDANAEAMFDLVVAMRAALVANGIMS